MFFDEEFMARNITPLAVRGEYKGLSGEKIARVQQ
jgi:hypothetical protein